MHKPGTADRCFDLLVLVGSGKKKYKWIDQFVTEAKLRGCCRHLSGSTDWMIPGKTRVFLLHRDGREGGKRVSLFGYFVLHRIEIITEPNTAARLSKAPILSNADLDHLWPASLAPYRALVQKCRQKQYSRKQIKSELERKLHSEHLSSVARGYVSRAPSILPKASDFTDIFRDALKDVLRDWMSHHHLPSHETAKCEGHRGCSTRGLPGRGAYVVDSLCAEIHDRYRELFQREVAGMSPVQQGQFVQQLKLDQKRIWDHWFNRSRRFSTSELLKVYRGPFLKAVNQISAERKPRFRVDPRLLEKASQRGELVVFNPYPVLELLSDVRSRGYCRIDGDELIRRIAAHKGKRPMVIQSIPYCKESQDMQIRTQNQLTALLAERVRVRKASVSRFLHELTALAHEQLENFGKFKLEGIGTISRGTSRKPIKFTPSTTLKVKAKGAEHLRRRPA